MTLSIDERREILAEASHFERPQAAVPEALKIVQRRRGWVSDDDVRDVAAALNLTPAEVDSIATFYSLIFRRPVGRHVILICDSVSCYVTGYEAVREHLSRRLGIGLGQTTADGRFTLLPTACLGLCEQAPALMIGDDVYGNLTPERVDAILAKYVC
jgi:NADH-quinone oxidoreductase subunit E